MADALCSSTIFSSFQRISLPRQPFNNNRNFFCKFASSSIRCGASKDSNGDGLYPWDPSFLHGDAAVHSLRYMRCFRGDQISCIAKLLGRRSFMELSGAISCEKKHLGITSTCNSMEHVASPKQCEVRFAMESASGAIEWVREDRVTLFTTDGLVQIGGSVAPRRISSADKLAKLKASQRFQRQESDYMDPKHGLCLGALFDIAATNGLDTGRRLCIFGFCRSIEMLSDVVEDTVLGHGGEIVNAEKASKGLQEKLTMTVAVPLLWGVPPVSETLHLAVRTGGGIVEKVYWQWDFL